MNYGGDATPRECWDKLSVDRSAVLIDVRTRAEWNFVGVPATEEAMQPVIGIEWQAFPEMKVDEAFASKLKGALDSQGATADTGLYFLCRTGGRSLAAAKAMTAIGYANTYNVVDGFEGDADDEGHRGNKNGWKAEGLPWKQS